MSAIFPTAPAKVNIHHIPSNADFITYGISNENLRLKAWMPAGLSTITLRNSLDQQYNEFYNNHCYGCPHNSLSFYYEHYKEYLCGDLCVKDDSLYNKVCGVYYRGFHGQTCDKGHVFEENDNPTFEVQNIVFQINLTYLGNRPRFQKIGDNAHLCAGYFDEETGKIYNTRQYSVPNVYGNGNPTYNNGNICWGSTGLYNGYNGDYVDQDFRPKTLRDISTLYFQAESNNDILRLSTFKQYNEEFIKVRNNDSSYNESSYDKFLCSGYDSLMLIDADADVQAFFTMIMAGFRPIPEAPHVMMIPLKNCTIERDGNVYFGFSTQEDSVGRCWYVSSEGYLIGQLDESYAYV